MRDLVKVFTEMFWGEEIGNIGFIKFLVTFVCIFVTIKFFMYITSDKNSDGQVAMSEYTGKWDAKTLAEYYAYDANRDGVITPGEALETTKSGYVRGVSAPRTTTGQSRTSKGGSSESKAAPAATSGPDEKYIKFAVSQIAKYDENKNGMLDGGEISIATQKSSMIKSSADSNGDGKITPLEIATALSKR